VRIAAVIASSSPGRGLVHEQYHSGSAAQFSVQTGQMPDSSSGMLASSVRAL
jgi:hypothetical protein